MNILLTLCASIYYIGSEWNSNDVLEIRCYAKVSILGKQFRKAICIKMNTVENNDLHLECVTFFRVYYIVWILWLCQKKKFY